MKEADAIRPTTTHNLKLREQYVRPIIEGKMRYQVRYNDRGYQAGDFIRFMVVTKGGASTWEPAELEYTSPDEVLLLMNRLYRIDFVTTMEGLEAGYVVFTISIADKAGS